jgi:outer membrane protein TolC
MNIRGNRVFLLAVSCLIFFFGNALASEAEPEPKVEPLTFQRAIELALKNSTAIAIADLDQRRAERGYSEARAAYTPQLNVGAGLGYSYGFPLSLEGAAPTLFNFNSQQALFNPAQREYIHAAKTEWSASTKSAADRRAQVVLDTALTYAELDQVESAIPVTNQQRTAIARVEQVSRDRYQAGVDSEVDLVKARLSVARVRMALAQSRAQADILRERLSQLTGLPAKSIRTVAESIPALPQVAVDVDEVVVTKAVESNPAVKVAEEQAVARAYRAKGDHRLLLPSLDIASQYGILAHYNNYDVYFRRETFQSNNLTVGGVIRFPIFNKVLKDRADASSLEALKAKKEAEEVKNQVATETLKLQRSIAQLAAAREVARLEYQLASSEVHAVQAKLDGGTATVRDQENARLSEDQHYLSYLDSSLQLDKAQMQLLRATGELEQWALGK